MSQKVKCPVCNIEYDIRGFPTHYGTKHPVEFAKSIGSQPNTATGVSLQDSAKIGELSDVVKAKDTQIAQLQDSLTKSDAAFLTVKAELADAISYEHERAIVVDFLDKLTPEGKIALSQRLGLATVEDSGKSCREALLAAIKWLENIKKYSAEAKDIMLNTIADKVGLNELKAAAGAKLSDTPQPEDELKPRIPGTPVLPDAETKPEEKPEETAPVGDVESPGEKWWREFQEGLNK